MTDLPYSSPNPSPESGEESNHHEELLLSLRRKEGNWVSWGQACASLQKAGYLPQAIFEATGFEPIQQNQIIVAAQVYDSMVKVGVSEGTRSHYSRIGSDSLYELRILTQEERAAAAEFLHSRNLDSENAREVAKAMKDYSRLGRLPEGFTKHPGDAVAYQYWRFAKQQSDLTERSRLIARGLMFAHSQTARQQIEQLLTDFGSSLKRPALKLPFYRLEAEEEMPRTIPVAGKLPLPAIEWESAASIQPSGAFGLVKTNGQGTSVALPGWQVVLNTQDPVAVLCHSSQLPTQGTEKLEEVLLVIDRAAQTWDANSYFLVEQAGNLELQWFPESPNVPLKGRLILVLRPKRILDESSNQDVWQIED